MQNAPLKSSIRYQYLLQSVIKRALEASKITSQFDFLENDFDPDLAFDFIWPVTPKIRHLYCWFDWNARTPSVQFCYHRPKSKWQDSFRRPLRSVFKNCFFLIKEIFRSRTDDPVGTKIRIKIRIRHLYKIWMGSSSILKCLSPN